MVRSEKGHKTWFPVPPDTLIDVHTSPGLHSESTYHGLFTKYKAKKTFFFSSWQLSNRKSPLEVGCWVAQPNPEAAWNLTWALIELILAISHVWLLCRHLSCGPYAKTDRNMVGTKAPWSWDWQHSVAQEAELFKSNCFFISNLKGSHFPYLHCVLIVEKCTMLFCPKI